MRDPTASRISADSSPSCSQRCPSQSAAGSHGSAPNNTLERTRFAHRRPRRHAALLVRRLIYALFDTKANRTGSMVAFGVSLVLRLGGGEPLLGLPTLIPYPEIFAALLPGDPAAWYQPEGAGMLDRKSVV